MKKVFIIAGMGRSSTSATARAFHESKTAFMGDNLLPAHESNPWGHYEDMFFLGMHEKILDYNKSSWKDFRDDVVILTKDREMLLHEIEKRNKAHEFWGFKDPRSSLFLDFKDLHGHLSWETMEFNSYFTFLDP